MVAAVSSLLPTCTAMDQVIVTLSHTSTLSFFPAHITSFIGGQKSAKAVGFVLIGCLTLPTKSLEMLQHSIDAQNVSKLLECGVLQ